MSFLFKGDEGPTNIPEGRGLFQAIAQAGLQSTQENNFGGRRRVRSRMAGEEGRRRSRLDEMRGRERRPKPDIGVGGGFGIPPKFPKGPRNPRGYLPFHRGPNKRRNVDDDNRRREVTTPGFPSDERPGIRPPRDRRPGIRPPRDRRPGIRPPRDEVSIMPVPPKDQIKFDLGFPSDDRPGIRPPRDNRRRSNDDINVGFGLIENPRRKRRRRSAQEKQEMRRRGSQRFRGEKINEQSN